MCKHIGVDKFIEAKAFKMGQEILNMEEDFQYICSRCSEQELLSLKAFVVKCSDIMTHKKGNWKEADCRIEKLAEAAGLHVSTTNTGGFCKKAMWVLYLKIVRNNLSSDDLDHYPSTKEFFEKYKSFKDRNEDEQLKLLETANWMHRIFKFGLLDPAKNKGLVLDIIPMFLENWDVRYVTGSGLKEATADRVLIYEGEGEISPAKRNNSKRRRTGVKNTQNKFKKVERRKPNKISRVRRVEEEEKPLLLDSSIVSPVEYMEDDADLLADSEDTIFIDCEGSNSAENTIEKPMLQREDTNLLEFTGVLNQFTVEPVDLDCNLADVFSEWFSKRPHIISDDFLEDFHNERFPFVC